MAHSVPPSRFDALRDGLFATCFSPAAASTRVGAEVELLAYDASTDLPIPLLGTQGLVSSIRALGDELAWRECRAYGPVPTFDVPGRAVISFEPGGQIEISTVPRNGVTELVRDATSIVATLRERMADEGIRLESVGIDWANDARCIPLQLEVERYQKMTRYFECIGPFGIRMMRQTAAIQVSLDRGERPLERWRLLNDLAPYLIGIFANSPHYCRAAMGHQSYRALCWRMLDASRTGVHSNTDDPASEYARFALAANDMLRSADGNLVSFAQRFDGSETDDVLSGAWRNHLTTLFPEVRPRGHFEVRSCDAVDPHWYAAPIVFLFGIAYDDRASAEARLLAAESHALLRAAGERGLQDAAIARTARDLFQLALDGATRLGSTLVGAEELEVARAFYATYTARDRSPADDRMIVVPPKTPYAADVRPDTNRHPAPSP